MSDARQRDGAIARRWWKEITDTTRGDRGALAMLRRCDSPTDAVTITPAIDLARQLARVSSEERFRDALGLAIVLANARRESDKRLMKAAGWKSFPGDRAGTDSAERPVLSELRFRRLLQTGSDGKIEAFRRLIRMLDGSVNIYDLAESYLYWGEKTKQRWAFEYFAVGQSAPAITQSPEGATP
jgi:CRISPR system Cascade subunit CasB